MTADMEQKQGLEVVAFNPDAEMFVCMDPTGCYHISWSEEQHRAKMVLVSATHEARYIRAPEKVRHLEDDSAYSNTRQKPLPNREYLLSIFEDIGDTVRWKVKRSPHQNAGDEARGIASRYYRVMVDQEHYLVHRILFKMRAGEEPLMIDHIDGDRLNNREGNLRPANPALNSRNRSNQRNNTSGFKNVVKCSRTGKWHAQVKVNGKNHYSKRFANILDAATAAEELRAKLHGDFAFLNQKESGE